MDRMRDAIAVSGNHIFIEDYTQHTVVCDMGPGPHTKPHMNWSDLVPHQQIKKKVNVPGNHAIYDAQLQQQMT